MNTAMNTSSRPARWALALAPLLIAVAGQDASAAAASGRTCSGAFPSYWQDPEPKFARMWEGQTVSNRPPEGWSGPVFRLSDGFPDKPVDDRANQPWRDKRFDALFDPATGRSERSALANDYLWAVMRYLQAGNTGSGNVGTDWTLCDNAVRPWFHMPFQTYDALSGREFVHGLTREAPVSFSMQDPDHRQASVTLPSTMWAVGFYNATGAYTLGQVWKSSGVAKIPAEDLAFDEGTVVGKLLFNTSSPDRLPMLRNMPTWQANISDPAFCGCRPAGGAGVCTMAEESRQCPRSLRLWGPVRLLQFDVAIKDSRAPATRWVFGTFVADGQRRAGEPDPWNRIAPLGLMWGNDPAPVGRMAHNHPEEPRKNGFAEAVIFWDTVDMLNAGGGEVIARRPGHLGCNGRLNGPADNPNSSCMSCHMTASVVDRNLNSPPIMAQFKGPPAITHECVTPDPSFPGRGTDAAGAAAQAANVSFAEMDALYFANTPGGKPVNTSVRGYNVLRSGNGEPWPRYASGRESWIALDYSLQLSISLVQWSQWKRHERSPEKVEGRRLEAILPSR